MGSCFLCKVRDEYVVKIFENFILVIDPYPLHRGHVMIISKQHYGCTGELPGEHFEELETIYAKLKLTLQNTFPGFISYEHGRAGTCVKNYQDMTCHHMHLHIVPVSVDLGDELSCRFPKSVTFEQLKELNDLFNSYGNYMLFFNGNNVGKFYVVQHNEVQPHLIRTLISHKLGRNDLSDWEHYTDISLQAENLDFRSTLMQLL